MLRVQSIVVVVKPNGWMKVSMFSDWLCRITFESLNYTDTRVLSSFSVHREKSKMMKFLHWIGLITTCTLQPNNKIDSSTQCRCFTELKSLLMARSNDGLFVVNANLVFSV